MLAWRLAVSAFLIPACYGIFYLDHQAGSSAPWLLGLCLVLGARCAWEMTTLLRTRNFDPHFPIVAFCTLSILLAGWLPQLEVIDALMNVDPLTLAMLAFSLSVLVLFLRGAIRYRQPGSSMETLGAELLSVTYVGVLLIVTAQLRWVAGAQAGYLALGSLVIAAKMGDIGGYTIGRLFGRAKLVPTLSPGKTRAGGVGALCGAGLGAWLWLTFATPLFNPDWPVCAWYWAVLYGVVVGLVGLVGDLCESLIKRDVEKKDSATLMPGFGGLLDLLDSILYAGPVAYLLWLLLPLASWQ